MNKRKKSTFFDKALPSLIAIAIGIVAGLIIIIVTNTENALEAIPEFLKGPFTTGLTGVGDLFYHITPLLMTGLAVAFAYQTGLFNIGASGQFILGGFLAILISAKLEKAGLASNTTWIVALLIAGLGGALLASIVGILKAYRNVNEVITCIMLNYTSMYLVNHFIKSANIYNQTRNSTIDISTAIPKLGIDKLFPNTIAGGGIVIALIIVIILHIILKKTTFGYELKGVGLNRHAAKYAGISENKSIILSMAISGLLAGLGGGMLYLSGAGNNIAVQDLLPSEGFDGIAISLLGLNEPIGVFLASILIGYLKLGGQAIQTLGYAPELITIITSFILYVSALSVLFKRMLGRKRVDLVDNINSEPPIDNPVKEAKEEVKEEVSKIKSEKDIEGGVK